MLDKLTSQQRLLLAVALSFVFFMGYEYFILSKYPPKKADANKTQVATNVASKKAPPLDIKTADAPKASSAPVSYSDPKNASEQIKPSSYIATVKGKRFELKIDSLGRISKYYLRDKKYNENKKIGGIYGIFFSGKEKSRTIDGKRAQLIEQKFTTKPLEIRFSDTNINNEAFKTSYTANNANINLNGEKKSIVLTQKLSDLIVTKTITFYPEGNYDVKVELSKRSDYFISPGSRPNLLADGYTFHGIIVQTADEKLEVLADGDIDASEEFKHSPVVSASDRYYTTLFYDFGDGLNVIATKGEKDVDDVFVRANSDLKIGGYIGPKDHKILSSINPKLTDVIEYGWFTFIAKPVFTLLNFLYGLIGNWGWAIVAMTFLIRVVLFPLTYKGMVSMNKLKELSPKIKELQARYKGEPQKLNAHMMELYKKHGANPMGGCLPILLQIPVFFAIYRVLQNAVELKDAPWILWVNDLSILDPWFVLPIAMGITMFLHQRLTPTNFTDPTQEKIMKFLPLIFTFFFVTFPAGLTLYWFINNIFSILQQMYVNSLFAKKKEQKVIKK